MKKQFLSLLFGIALIPATLTAQDTLRISFQDALIIADQNRPEFKILRAQQAISDNAVKKVQTKYLPQVNAAIDSRVNTQLQTSILPGEILGRAGQKIPVQFGTRYNTTLGISLNQSLYNPQIGMDDRIAREKTGLQQTETQRTENEIHYQVAQAYCQVLLNRETSRISADAVERSRLLMETAKARREYGTLVQTESEKFEVDHANAMSTHEKNLRTLELSMDNLLYLMGLPEDEVISLTDEMAALEEMGLAGKEGPENRAEYQREIHQLELNRLQYERAGRGYVPSAAIYAAYTLQQLSNNFNYFEKDTWFPFSYIGLRIDAPLFDGLLKEREKQEYRLQQEVNRRNMEKLRNDIRFEITSAKAEMENALTQVQTTQRTMELARKVVSRERDRLKEGLITLSDFRNTEFSLRESEGNYITARYNYLVAFLKMMKANGAL